MMCRAIFRAERGGLAFRRELRPGRSPLSAYRVARAQLVDFARAARHPSQQQSRIWPCWDGTFSAMAESNAIVRGAAAFSMPPAPRR